MPKRSRLRLPRLTGKDGDFMHFSCPSFTTPGVEYDIAIHIDTGVIECNCMDARTRHKRDLVTADAPNVCKHSRLVLVVARLLCA